MIDNYSLIKAKNPPDAITVAETLSRIVEPIVENILQEPDGEEVLRQLNQLEKYLEQISLKIRYCVDPNFSVDLQIVKQRVLITIAQHLASIFNSSQMYVACSRNYSNMIREIAERHHLNASDALYILFEAECNQEIKEVIRDPHHAKIRMSNICFCEKHYGLDASTYKRVIWKTAIVYWQEIVQESPTRGREASFALRNILTFFPEGESDTSFLHQCEDICFEQLLTSLEEAVQKVLEAKRSSHCHLWDTDLIWEIISILQKLNKFHLIGATRKSFSSTAIEKAINGVLKKYNLDISFFSRFKQWQNDRDQLRRQSERSTAPTERAMSLHDIRAHTRNNILELLA